MYEGNTFGEEVMPTSATGMAGGDGSTHVAQRVDEWRNKDTQLKRRQRAYKVCSLIPGAKDHITAYYCADCIRKDSNLPLYAAPTHSWSVDDLLRRVAQGMERWQTTTRKPRPAHSHASSNPDERWRGAQETTICHGLVAYKSRCIYRIA
ncbi:hypothetical protein ON010_g592 [Phytophthora cinnamomi]|nr:hypothetical protein ON010_g592 [Phytophthora cinnamomi]